MSKEEDLLQNINTQLKNIVEFLTPLLPLANSHLVQFITEDQWNTYIPDSLSKELMSIQLCDLLLILKPQSSHNHHTKDISEECFPYASLKSFSKHVRRLSSFESREIFQPISGRMKNVKDGDQALFERAMNKKKAYEVALMSQFIKNLCTETDSEWVVDVGSGLGHLSSALVIQKNIKTFAIDSSSSNVANTLKRSRVLQTLKRSEKATCSKVNLEPGPAESLVETKNNVTTSFEGSGRRFFGLTKFVTSEEDAGEVLVNNFVLNNNEEERSLIERSWLGIVGLHTCGNLAPTSLKMFIRSPRAKFLCNVGCCYHLLKEEFAADIDVRFSRRRSEPDAEDRSRTSDRRKLDQRYHDPDFDPMRRRDETGFPLSMYLKRIRFSLGRNARDLACKSTRGLSASDKNLQNLFWRSLLEVIVRDVHGSWPDGAYLGRKHSKTSTNFCDYCKKAFVILGLPYELSDEEIWNYYRKYSTEKDLLMKFYVFKVTLGPLIEKVLLLDRLLFLYEQGFSRSKLVQLFDEEVSPRCCAVVSYRD